ncbi:hypothetical protein D3C86_1577420 [compost metagenome]
MAPDASEPSPSAAPPAPPPTGPKAAMKLRPSEDVVRTLTMLMPPAGDAGIKSGIARENAPMVAYWTTLQVRLRIPTAAGAIGLTTVPSGRMHVATRSMPALRSRSGFSV